MSLRLQCFSGILLAMLGSGNLACKKQGNSPAPAEVEMRKTAESVSESPELTELLGQLTQQVRKFGVEQQKAPKQLQELVQAGYLSTLPIAPAGKKFAIGRTLEVYLTAE